MNNKCPFCFYFWQHTQSLSQIQFLLFKSSLCLKLYTHNKTAYLSKEDGSVILKTQQLMQMVNSKVCVNSSVGKALASHTNPIQLVVRKLFEYALDLFCAYSIGAWTSNIISCCQIGTVQQPDGFEWNGYVKECRKFKR